MTKKGPLSNVDKDFIRSCWMKKSVSEIADELNRAEGTVQKFIDADCEHEPMRASRSFDAFGRNDKGSTVMTKAASEIADELKKKMSMSTKTKNCITSVRKDD